MSTETEKEILKRLHDYGESVLEPTSKKKKPKKKQTVCEIIDEKTLAQREKNKKRKNRRKRQNEMKLGANNNKETKPQKLSNIDKIVQMFDLGDKSNIHKSQIKKVSEETVQQTVSFNDFVDKEVPVIKKRKSKKPLKNKRTETEVFVFKDPKKSFKKKVKPTKETVEETEAAEDVPPENPIFNMDEAKFEVRKLGITGFEENKQEESMVDLLVSLGAKPPKKKCVNYKDLQKQRKDEIKKDKEKKEMDRKLGIKVKKGPAKKQKRDVNDISIKDGQIGRYEHGTQFVKKKHVR